MPRAWRAAAARPPTLSGSQAPRKLPFALRWPRGSENRTAAGVRTGTQRARVLDHHGGATASAEPQWSWPPGDDPSHLARPTTRDPEPLPPETPYYGPSDRRRPAGRSAPVAVPDPAQRPGPAGGPDAI